ncbi:MAG: hypothetical protein KF745_11540 [Phycisphaeraceae bacterium]|nr:hypothetical protein [Phycisphaeraceae bacterium]
MASQGAELLQSSGRAMVPAWARRLTPHMVASRLAGLAAGGSAGLEHYRGDGIGMVAAVVPGATSLSTGQLNESVAAVFELVLAGLNEGGFPHPLRTWAFVPGIHDQMDEGLDRYRVFNLGRFAAYTRCFGTRPFAGVLPAASAVGHDGDHLVVCAMGSGVPGVPVENPRQIPAFEYSRAYGPRPPCFARATVASLPLGRRLLVSGTASIRGEDSVHPGSLSLQLEETLANIDRLARGVPGPDSYSIDGTETARVYFRRPADRSALRAALSGRLPRTADVEYFPAKICRAELLVEIEATVVPGRMGGAPHE